MKRPRRKVLPILGGVSDSRSLPPRSDLPVKRLISGGTFCKMPSTLTKLAELLTAKSLADHF